MAESIESMRRATVEVVDLPTKQLEPDPANANRVDPALMEAMRTDIVEHGFVQPIVVRNVKNAWRITDGEHRWRLLDALGAETTPCVIDDAGDDDAAHMRMLTMNQLRGRPNPVRLGRQLVRIAEEIGEDELQQRLGMEEDEYEATAALADADEGDEALKKALAAEEKTAPEVLRWRIGPRQAQQVERALDDLLDNGAKNRAEALLTLLEAA